MTKKHFLTIVIFCLMVIAFWLVVKNAVNRNEGSLVGSGFIQQIIPGQPTPTPTSIPTPVPPQAPKTFQFDSSTDLKMELEKVNPQVLDSDFE